MPGCGAAFGDQAGDDGDQVGVRGGGAGGGFEGAVDRGADPVDVLVGDAVPGGEDQQRDAVGVLAEQVGLAGAGEFGDELFGDGGGVALQQVGFEDADAVGDDLPVAGVRGAVGEQRGGAPAHHRQDRRVGGLGGLPGARVAGPGVGVAEDLQGDVVVGDQPGVDAGGEFDGGERSAVAQPGVVVVRPGGELRAVEGGAGHGAVSWGRRSRTCSVRAIRASRQPSRSRASHSISGVAGSRSSAARILSSSIGGVSGKRLTATA